MKIASIASVPARITRRGGVRVASICKPLGVHPAGAGLQLANDRVEALDGLDPPSQGQDVTPMAVEMEQRPQRRFVGIRESSFELREPRLNRRSNVVRSSQHLSKVHRLKSPSEGWAAGYR